MRTNLISALCDRGARIDVLLGKTGGPYIGLLDRRVRVIPLRSSHRLWSIYPLARYLARERPSFMVTEKLRVNAVALRARRLVRSRTAIFSSIHGVVSHKIHQQRLPARKSRAKEKAALRFYPGNDGLIAVSSGIAQDLITNYSIPPERVHVVPNPVVTAELYDKAREDPGHSWLARKDDPVIAWVGRLSREKRVSVLLGAFRILRQSRSCRLILVGDGPERAVIEELIRDWHLDDCVSMVGFQLNPFAFLARCDLLALSSAWEGFGNVLVEAMALGVPVVSTDCPVGPREILDGGQLGRLVPVDDETALADAMAATLSQPPRPDVLRAAAERYTADACAAAYLRIFGIES
jgi:glycosyltransferase involved in cell wall biosynthesis